MLEGISQGSAFMEMLWSSWQLELGPQQPLWSLAKEVAVNLASAQPC